MTDWVSFAGKEIGLGELQSIWKSLPKTWGWSRGMFIAGNDDMIALRFMTGRDYEPVTRALWRKLCEGAELVSDVGTHSGVFTLDAYRSGVKRVLAVEPHPINYSRLVLNLRYNGFDYAGVVYGALGNYDGIAVFGANSMYFVHAAGKVGGEGVKYPVRVMRMDNLLPKEEWGKLKAVKIDAENLTPSVIEGMGKILEHKPDLIIECIDEGMDKLLKDYGYRFWIIRESGSIEPVETLVPVNPDNNYNGTDDDCRNRFASVRDLP